MANASMLDPGQIIKHAYEDDTQSIRVTTVSDSSTNLNVVASLVIPYTNINGSGGAVYELTASTPSLICKLVPNEQTGVAINIYTGSAGNEVRLLTLAPGQDNEVPINIVAGTRVSIRATGVTAPSSGSVYLIFCG